MIAQPTHSIRYLFFNSHKTFLFFVCLVGVAREAATMENESLFNERQSIRDSARQLKKYGSTCNHVRNNDVFIRHNLDQSDTLQGIALKYGCTVRKSNPSLIPCTSLLHSHAMWCGVIVVIVGIVVAGAVDVATPHYIFIYSLSSLFGPLFFEWHIRAIHH